MSCHNPATIDSAYVAFWTDTDLGEAHDDYVGTATTLSLVYAYNADNDDGDYGENPPAIGFTPIEFEHVSGRGSGNSVLSRPAWFTNGIMHLETGGGIGYTRNGPDMYNYMRSIWRDGRHMTNAGLGRDGTERIDFSFPGDPVTAQYWSGLNIDGTGQRTAPNDIRMLGSIGPTQIATNDTLTFTIAVIWSRGDSNIDSITRLREDTAFIRSISDVILQRRSLPLFEESRPTPEFALGIYPQPANEFATVRYSLPQSMTVKIDIYDSLGRHMWQIDSVPHSAGIHSRRLDTGQLQPGLYVVRVQFDRITATRKLIVL